MTFLLMKKKKKKRWLSQPCSYRESGRIPDSIILVPLEVGLIASEQMYLAIESRSRWELSPSSFEGIETSHHSKGYYNYKLRLGVNLKRPQILSLTTFSKLGGWRNGHIR